MVRPNHSAFFCNCALRSATSRNQVRPVATCETWIYGRTPSLRQGYESCPERTYKERRRRFESVIAHIVSSRRPRSCANLLQTGSATPRRRSPNALPVCLFHAFRSGRDHGLGVPCPRVEFMVEARPNTPFSSTVSARDRSPVHSDRHQYAE